MSPELRREAILDIVRQNKELRVDEIAERFGVSRETIRRDLAQLDARQLLRRVHGGAERPRTGIEANFRQRLTENTDSKARIARTAAALFEENDTLMIDTGSTTEAFAAALGARGRFSVVTNSAGVAWHLHNSGGSSRVYLIGGEYRGEMGETVGTLAIDQVARFRADHAVLTVGGLDASGCMDFDVEEAMMARAMIRQTQSVTVVADHSKLGRIAMYQVCDLSVISRLVTDQLPESTVMSALRSAGVDIIVAD